MDGWREGLRTRAADSSVGGLSFPTKLSSSLLSSSSPPRLSCYCYLPYMPTYSTYLLPPCNPRRSSALYHWRDEGTKLRRCRPQETLRLKLFVALLCKKKKKESSAPCLMHVWLPINMNPCHVAHGVSHARRPQHEPWQVHFPEEGAVACWGGTLLRQECGAFAANGF